uniref:Pollen allergen Amb t 5 n=1 Tax=Ambrosia trifida TaxID=4214 RepID=MPAT5_AMBTR|nr:RecName: Full=Pollen allergen Amb t 5; AltName: Full=Allergen Amb t V; AltName: Full=Allergen Ra5G; AltName: Allergen=Amb t 5; Flags: Precursor [Ambrosia trifida]AAB02877.1 MHC class II antigen [Ambrosia trifida]CAA39726.1 Amb t V allergen [Ambrosia trifida]
MKNIFMLTLFILIITSTIKAIGSTNEVDEIKQEDDGLCYEGTNCGKVGKYCCSPIGKYCVCYDSKAICNKNCT